jgi:hypothetical protein
MSEVGVRAALRVYAPAADSVGDLLRGIAEGRRAHGPAVEKIYVFVDVHDEVQLYYCQLEHEEAALRRAREPRRVKLVYERGSVLAIPSYLEAAFARARAGTPLPETARAGSVRGEGWSEAEAEEAARGKLPADAVERPGARRVARADEATVEHVAFRSEAELRDHYARALPGVEILELVCVVPPRRWAGICVRRGNWRVFLPRKWSVELAYERGAPAGRAGEDD